MRRNKRGNWFQARKFEIAIAFIFVALGFVVGLATRYELQLGFQFDDKIDAVELLTLVCTLILAWLVATVIDKQKEAEKSAKEILIKRVEEFHSFVVNSASRSASGSLAYSEAAHITKRIDVTVQRLLAMLESLDIDYDPTLKKSLAEQAERLDDVLTVIEAPELMVENNIIRFNEDRALAVETAFDALRDQITTLEIDIFRG